jgi:hypothetical protein
MEENESVAQLAVQPDEVNDAPAIGPSAASGSGMRLAPQARDEACNCGRPGGKCVCTAAGESNLDGAGSRAPAYIYALGKVQTRFPSLAIEKEFVQATGRAETEGLTDQQAFQAVLSERQNRYLARQMCWVLTVEGLDTYILRPRDPADIDMLIEAVRPVPSPGDVDIVIGLRGPIAPPEMCNGLMVPIVIFDQIYSFDTEALVKAIPRPQGITASKFQPAAEELFNRIMQLADNAGATDEHRALNYLAVRYDAIYAQAAEAFGGNRSLTAVDVRPSRLSGTRKIVQVIFAYTHRETDVTDKYFVRVDVTEEFPFLVTKLSPFYDR